MDKFTALANEFLTGDDFVATAKKLLTALKVPKPAIAILLPVIANAVRLVVRNDTREAEHEVFAATHADPAPSDGTQRDLLTSRFALPDGRWITWGEATIADHAARIEYLEKLRGGLERTIGQHRETIERLNAAGASCLNELQAEPKKKGRPATRAAEPRLVPLAAPTAP